MNPQLRGPKGAPDWLPERSALYERVIDEALSAFRIYGFGRIETPAFENTDLFLRGLSTDSEIVTKEMYTFEDKGGRSLTLRPDMTAPVMRSVLEHNLHRKGLPAKFYYTVPVFRHERPQSGRYRQHTQVGVEVVGSPGPDIDAEVVRLALDVFRRIGIDVEMRLNSLGHPECRAAYLPILQSFLRARAHELCPDCNRKIETNPLRTFDCKVEADRKIMAEAPLITSHLCDECAAHFGELRKSLERSGVKCVADPTLVRGLDYYVRTLFEFTAPGLGSQDAVGGGGRYDGLSEALGGPHLPGIGFGLGVDRIVLALEAGGALAPARLDVFVVCATKAVQDKAAATTAALRNAGIRTDLDLDARTVKAQFKAADRLRARWTVVVGEAEIAAGSYTVKDMQSGEESRVANEDLIEKIKARL